MSSTSWALHLIKILSGNKPHITKMAIKIARVIGVLNKLKHISHQHILLTIYNSLIQPHLSHELYLWGLNYKRLKYYKRKQLEFLPFARTYHILPRYLKL